MCIRDRTKPATTFGKKKSKVEQKKKKPAAELEIKAIEVVEPPATAKQQPAKGQSRKGGEKAAAKNESKRESHAIEITSGEMEIEIFETARSFVEPIFTELGVSPEYRTEIKDGILWIILSGEKLGLLIGRRGETLNAIQYLANLAVNRKRGERVRLVLDVEGYRESREQTLHALAKKMACLLYTSLELPAKTQTFISAATLPSAINQGTKWLVQAIDGVAHLQ